MLYSAGDIINGKEKRARIQNNLMQTYNMPLLFMKVNYPCAMKNNKLTNCIAKEMDKLLTSIFEDSIEYKVFSNTAEGPIIMMIINEPTRKIKEIAIAIEDKHVLGKVIQIIIYDNVTGNALGREEIGERPKKCIICDNSAEECTLKRPHTKEEVIREINRAYIEYLENFHGVIM